MCIAILKTKNGHISDEELRNSFNNNSDGAGIAYTKDNELRIVKGIFDVETFVTAVRQAEKLADNNILIHCRIGTSGKKDKDNTHPFVINNNICLIHNGILDVEVPKDSPINDTQIFIQKFMRGIKNETILKNKTYQNVIEELIGKGNKFVIMNNKGEFVIMNEQAGHWANDVWFSNSSYSYSKTSWTDYRKFGKQYKQYPLFRNYCYDDEEEFEYDYVNQVDDSYYDYNNVSEDQYYEIVSQIQELAYEDVVKFGRDICYDLKNMKFIDFNEAQEKWELEIDDGYIFLLEELSVELYDLYIDFAENILEAYEVA